jgi:hypothetical protein
MRRFALLPALALLAACATPVAPTGGPVDATPPALVASAPAAGAVRVNGRTLTLTFSERVDPATAVRAIRVTPESREAGEANAPPVVRVRAEVVTVELPPLREATTYVVTVGTDLADTRGVRLAAPLTVAFSTGDALDAGRLDGLVRDPDTGRPVGGLAVWAYLAADSLAADSLADPRRRAPDYRTETAADGRFRLDYLRDADAFVVAVADANRNSRADDGEAFAVPTVPRLRPSLPDSLRADSTARDSTALASSASALAGLWLARADTTAPEVRALRAATARRLVLRLSEPVRLRHVRGWTAEDSLTGAVVPLRPWRASPSEIALASDAPLPAAGRLRLSDPTAVADSSGLALAPFVRAFTAGAARADTSAARVVAWVPSAVADSVRTLRTAEWPAARFTAAPDTSALALVSPAGDVLPSRVETDDGLTLRLVPLAPPPAGTPFTLRVSRPDTTVSRRFRTPATDETGGIVGAAPWPDAVVEARPVAGGPTVTARAGADGRFAVAGLVAGRYDVRAFADADGDGRWSGGRLAPYVPPEPLARLPEPAAVRARWDTEVAFDGSPAP